MSGNTQLAVCTRKGLFRLEPAPKAGWNIVGRHFVGEPVTAAMTLADGRRWIAALRMGHFGVKLRTSADGGATWSESPAPAYGPQPPAQPGEQADPHPWSVDQVWTLAGAHPLAPERVWAGTIPGGLFRSDDGGARWSLNEPLWRHPQRHRWFGGGYDYPGVHSISAAPDDPDDIVVGVSCGGVWRSRDGGASWAAGRGLRADYMPPEQSDDPITQDPHRVVRCAAAPQCLWMQHHNGIWRSGDGGSTWTEITGAIPSSFGFAVAVDPADPDHAWFVPAQADAARVPVDGRMSVSETRDAGRSWRCIDRGLPGVDAYHLVYRHGLAISADRRFLAMGSTTGSLWISGDGGQAWDLVSATLPPIYAVEFC